MIKISPARLAAYEVLKKIQTERAYSSVLLPLYEEKLSAPDRRLTHELTLGILRKQLYLDRIIEALTKKKISKFDLEVVLALRLGLYQILYLDKIPASAAVNESVNIVQMAKKTSAKGLVNAVLRKAAREEIKLDYADEIEKLSIETSHPRWLLEKWVKDFGYDEAVNLAVANNQTPKLVFRLTNKSDEKTVEILKKLDVELIESKIVPGAWTVVRPNEMLYTFADEGKIYFQEESSQLVGSLINLNQSEKFLDVCAAPGSKTTYIAKGNSKDQPKALIAGDLHWNRVKFLKENCQKQGSRSVKIVRYDAEKALPFAQDTFDCILVDAPCSGTGTIRHNPEIRYFVTEEDLKNLFVKQLTILNKASNVLKSGARLIYSTCSLEQEENEAVINRFLADNPGFSIENSELPQHFLSKDGFGRTYPHRDETDGFFIAQLKKN